jgi:hypothetical protein
MKFLLAAALPLLVSCLPQVEGRSAAVEQQRTKPKLCTLAFERGWKLPEIADCARQMKIQCEWPDEEILRKARDVYN